MGEKRKPQMKGATCLLSEQSPLHVGKSTISVLCNLTVANGLEYSWGRLRSANVLCFGQQLSCRETRSAQPLLLAQVKAILATHLMPATGWIPI